MKHHGLLRGGQGRTSDDVRDYASGIGIVIVYAVLIALFVLVVSAICAAPVAG